MAKIPKILIQFSHDQDELPDALLSAMEATKKSQCNYKYMVFDDVSALAFIEEHYDSMWSVFFSRNQIAASRCDIARLLILKQLGGFYVDLSMELKKSISCYRGDNLVLLQRDDLAIAKNHLPQLAHCTNSFIACPPNSIFIELCIELMKRRLLSKQYNKDVINATGPGILNTVLSTGLFNLGINKIPFSWGREQLFNYVRIPKFSNTWTEQQKLGIFRD